MIAAVVSTFVLVMLAALALAGPAAATTWSVPAFHAACPDNGTNVQEINLKFAMESQGDDGIADRIFIKEGILSFPGPLNPVPGTFSEDPLEVIGAGAAETKLTLDTGGNVFVVNLSGNNFSRPVTMRDLTILVPPESGGFSSNALQTTEDVFERVNFESLDSATGSGANAVSIINGGVFRDVKVFGTAGGSFARVFNTGNSFPGDELVITDSVVTDSTSGITDFLPSVLPVTISRSHFQVNGQVVSAGDGDTVTVENSIIEAGEFTPFFSFTNDAESSSLILRNNTIVNLGGAGIAIRSAVGPAATGSASTIVRDSIIVGFSNTWDLKAPVSGSLGDANLDLAYSNVSSSGTKVGDGTLSATVGVIDETPLFAGFNDFHLTAQSPSIDAGDPAAGGLSDDFEGNLRPLDGNGDGSAVRDQGAYEAPAAPPNCVTDPSFCPDQTGPKVTRVKFTHGRSPKRGGKLRLKVNEASSVKVVFKPTPAGKGKKKRKVVKFSRRTGRAAGVSIKIRKGKLRPGRYRLTIKAVDDSGNRSKAVVRKVKVKK